MKFRVGFIILGIANGIETIIGLQLFQFALGFMYIPGTLWTVLLIVSVLIIGSWVAFYKITVNRRQKLMTWALITFFVMGALNAIIAVFLILNGGLAELVPLVITSIFLAPAILYIIGSVLLIQFARSVIGESNVVD